MKKDFLLLPERMILESLSKGNKTKEQLSEDVGISENIILKIVTRLKERGMVVERDHDNFLLVKRKIELEKKEKTPHEKKIEAEEIFQTMVTNLLTERAGRRMGGGGHGLAFKKIWVTQHEEIYLNSILSRLGSFINDVAKRKNHLHQKTMNQKLIFWGQSSYSSIMSSYLKNI